MGQYIDKESAMEAIRELLSSLCEDNACGILTSCDDKAKRRVVLDYLCVCIAQVPQREEFLSMPSSFIVTLLATEGINLSEDELLEVIIRWIKHNQPGEDTISLLFKLVKAPYLSPQLLDRHVEILGIERVNNWKSLMISDLHYRLQLDNDLRTNKRPYQPRQFELLVKRWQETIRSNGMLPSIKPHQQQSGLFSRYIGLWSSGPSKDNYFAYSFVLELDCKPKENDKYPVEGRIKWRLEHFYLRHGPFDVPFYHQLAKRFRHREDEVVEGFFYPHERVLSLTGTAIEPYVYQEEYETDVIALDHYRIRVLNQGQVLSGVAKGHQTS